MEKDSTNETKTWISFRVKPEEYAQIKRRFKKSACRKLSDYARKVLMEKPVVVVYRNQSADDFLAVATAIIKELNAIGNNFNQAVHKLHTLKHIEAFKGWYISWNIEKQTLQNKVAEVRQILIKLYEDGCQDQHAK